MSKGGPDVSWTESKRKSRGRSREDASFPVPAGKSEMPADYAAVLDELKNRIRSERLRVTLVANSAMVLLYWDIGKVILDRQERQGWGAKVIDRLSHDLKLAFPDMSVFSPRNLKYMHWSSVKAAADWIWFTDLITTLVLDMETRSSEGVFLKTPLLL
ncbi:MAG: hypothetical protein JW986_05000 [Methanotrichaceae archaeon]|nr:hypothetical protein [Methanotrichaceae archaeon]